MTQRNEWRKSSYSGGQGGNCVEINESPAAVSVRDSKDKSGPTLTFDRHQWSAFVDFARRTNRA